ncbi:MAG: adenine deaminase [Chloroflexi bacterium]|nr:adenine deaminase [Chloroflexota bacterium]
MTRPLSPDEMRELTQVSLGEAGADLAIVNGTVVNVYTAELMKDVTVLIKGERIAYIGKNTGKAISPSTQIIDARGKVLIPGLIDGHTHAVKMYSTSELVKAALKDGTTTVITEVEGIGATMGYRGIIAFLASAKNQPMKFFVTVPPIVVRLRANEYTLTRAEFRRLLQREEVVGMGESYWAQVISDKGLALEFIADTMKRRKKVDGHSAGARDNKLQAYIATGVSSCHEPTNPEELRERLRAGLFVFVREGGVRRDLEAIARIKSEQMDLRRLALCTDEIIQIATEGYMASVVQKAIDLGFDPITAIQMATINSAQRFGLDDSIGGIAPGKYADIVIVPDLKTVHAEWVISNGQVVSKNGELLIQPRHRYARSVYKTTSLPRKLDAADFTVPAQGQQAKVRVIDLVTSLVTREAIIGMPVSDGQLQVDTDKDILKASIINRTHTPGRQFTGFVHSLHLKHGAIATTTVWDVSCIGVVGASEADMALAANRVVELGGGTVVCSAGKILAELALPVAGVISEEPMEVVLGKCKEIQTATTSLGSRLPDTLLSIGVLTTSAIPFLRMSDEGLVDVKQNRVVDLIAP